MKKNYSINDIEQLTSISKEKLRIWEHRYDFPNPKRDEAGNRVYSQIELNKLMLISKLIGHGHRPGKLTSLSEKKLTTLLDNILSDNADFELSEEEKISIEVLKTNDGLKIKNHFNSELLKHGIKKYILDYIQKMNITVGKLWERGDLTIYQEHLYSDIIQYILRQAVEKVESKKNKHPTILLTTLEGELHQIGILMVYGLLKIKNCNCIYLGPNLPAEEISKAIEHYKADICALSVSSIYNKRDLKKSILSLQKNHTKTCFWIGGKGSQKHLFHSHNIKSHSSLESIYQSLNHWQKENS